MGRRPTPLAQLHGTYAGYKRHRYLGGIPCQACQDANNAYMREYQRKHYNPAKRRARYVEKGY